MSLSIFDYNKFSLGKSNCERLDNLTPDKIAEIAERYGTVVLWKTDGVFIKTEIKADDVKEFSEIRAFNETDEFHAVTIDGVIKGRIRTDGDGTDIDFYDELHKLWGDDKPTCKDGGMELRESRGTVINLPFDLPVNTVFVKIRNYYDGKFTDKRFVKFEGMEAASYENK
jgi:CRISPR-associated protein (TIGR03984 family)